MPVTIGGGLSFCGRELRLQELDLVRLTELAHTVCELLEWRRPNGSLKGRECYLFLQALHDRGWLPWLPSPQVRTCRARATVLDFQSEVQSPLTGALGDYLPLRLHRLESRADRRLFQQYIQRYHYLGYRVPFGAQLRYFVRSQQPPCPLLACLLFTSAAWKMAGRDAYIGWNAAARKVHLPQVLNNSRFLILPWVHLPNLASHILSLAAQQLPCDWFAVYHVKPLLLETLVEEKRYHGGCYRAANWIPVGLTQGRGRMDRSGKAQRTRKRIFLYPLHRHWRRQLCTETL
jgi:hypothetical protein